MSRWQRTAAALVSPEASARRVWLTWFLLAAGVYALTGHWQVSQVMDARAASLPGWSLAHRGTLFLTGTDDPGNFAVYEAGGHVVAGRTAGVIWAGIPLQLLLGCTGMSAAVGSALTALLLTAAAAANLGLLLRTLLTPAQAVVATAVTAFGTPMWSVASAELWTHGPALFWLTGALLLVVRDHWWAAGACFAMAFVTRPHLAVVAAVVAAAAARERRDLRPLVQVGAPGAVAAGAVWAWNAWYYGQGSLLGAYQGHEQGLSTVGSTDYVPSFWENVAGMLVSPGCGVLLFTPVVVVLLPRLRGTWSSAPTWARSSAVGGVAYALVQARLNAFNGGGGFFGYRLTLESVVLAAPLLAWACFACPVTPLVRRAAVATAAVSVWLMGIGSALTYYLPGGGDWDVWYPWALFRAAGVAFFPAALVVTSAMLLVLALAQRVRDQPAVTT